MWSRTDPKDSEYAAVQRLLRRAIEALVCDELGLPVAARLKDNLPELSAAVDIRQSADSETAAEAVFD